jgi:hypothetical protein
MPGFSAALSPWSPYRDAIKASALRRDVSHEDFIEANTIKIVLLAKRETESSSHDAVVYS